MNTKVFCVGFHKTGTSSLGAALKALGYRVTGPNGVSDPDIENNVLAMAFDLAEKYDAFQDNPWPIIYKELDEKYPGSKFVLMLRSPEAWINSQVRHFGRNETPMRKWIYGVGCPKGNEDIYVERFNRHIREVVNYFKGRPEDLLVMDLAKGDGWDKLCPFIGADVPNGSFPHANKAGDRELSPALKALRRAKGIAKRITRRFTWPIYCYAPYRQASFGDPRHRHRGVPDGANAVPHSSEPSMASWRRRTTFIVLWCTGQLPRKEGQ